MIRTEQGRNFLPGLQNDSLKWKLEKAKKTERSEQRRKHRASETSIKVFAMPGEHRRQRITWTTKEAHKIFFSRLKERQLTNEGLNRTVFLKIPKPTLVYQNQMKM
jgi:hypothetical protein